MPALPTPALNPATDPAERRKGIGGSDVAVLLGLSPYKTALDLWMEKRGLWVDQAESEAALWGTIMEPVLLAEYTRRFACPVLRKEGGLAVVTDPGFTGVPHTSALRLLETLAHPSYPWARAHVDGVGLTPLGGPSHVVETKTADLRLAGHWGEPDTDEVPEYYLVQVMWYLWLADLDVAHLAVLIGGNRFRRYIIPRDEALVAVMIDRAAEFWERVESDNPPAPEPDERGVQSLARLYPGHTPGKVLTATPDVLELARDLDAVRRTKEEAEGAEKALQVHLKGILADAERINLSDDGKAYVSWKNNKDKRATNHAAVVAELVEKLGISAGDLAGIVARHTTVTPGARVFRCQGFEKLFGEG